MTPLLGVKYRMQSFNKVDLPVPLGPIRETLVPGSIDKLRWSTTVFSLPGYVAELQTPLSASELCAASLKGRAPLQNSTQWCCVQQGIDKLWDCAR
ncbi:uncharacterized protein PgNI_11513 [Pyricularia grisea]|uniref:Uncharacterized protein n=1 Tax=Pyricularia grisea TaxID=148305 RepID=A0A6P8AP12_PYRGI|nr:uncharacterized protein PgNI_11513 [Pyricularia grisea]TLD03784.1 hypothetical protein PgNI_11513 [Pyricularia grisea]